MLLNVFFPRFAVAPFDPAPFVWLQGLVGLGALLTTIIVLITQTRQGKLAEQRAQLDLHVSLLTEQKIATLVALVEELRRDPPDVTNRHDAQATAMEQSTDLHAILNALETVPEPPPVDARFRPQEAYARCKDASTLACGVPCYCDGHEWLCPKKGRACDDADATHDHH